VSLTRAGKESEMADDTASIADADKEAEATT